MRREIAIPKPLENILMRLYSPVAHSQAVAAGTALVLMESSPVQFLRKHIRPDMENSNLGNFIERFKRGYDTVLRAYEYRK